MSLKKLFILIVALIIVVALSMTLFSRQHLLKPGQQDVVLRISPGTSANRIGLLLTYQTQFDSPHLWKYYIRLTGNMHHLQAGEYLITDQTTVKSLLEKLKTGDVLLHEFTIVPGWTFKQVKQALVAQKALKNNLQGLNNQQIAKQLGIKHANPEGLFFPDTYQYVWGDTDLQILQRAHQRMEKVVQQAWNHRAKNLRYHFAYQVLIVASMIEKETAKDNERSMIAGVILRRLHKRMRLQIDPTVVYGLGLSYGAKLTYKDLRSHTPYNTYVHYGLPPTPICMPSSASITAALHPDHSGYLYYVAKGDGSHVFAKTYQQQRKNVRRYILKSGRRNV